MPTELISIIVPVYNVREYLDHCVESILAQTYKNLEVILVDDGSTDGSSELCDQWKTRDPRIIVIHKPNGGLSDARNAGLDSATGDFIGYVDSDDSVEPEMFQLLHDNLVKYDADVSCCRYARVYPDGRREAVGEDHRVHLYEGLDCLKEFLYGKRIDPFVCNKLYRACYTCDTDGIKGSALRFIKGIVGEDNPFNTAVLKQTRRVVVAGEAKYNYLQERQGAITSSGISQKRIDSVHWWDAISRECHEKYPDLEPYALRRQVIFYIGLYNASIRSGEHTEIRKDIVAFLKEHKSEILASPLNERIIKFSSRLLLFSPLLYGVAMRTYKRFIGSAASLND